MKEITGYQCQHCKKVYLVKHACLKHEAICNSNPANSRACSGCIHLEEISNVYDDYNGETRHSKSFRCAKLDKILYPFKVERMNLPEKYPETFAGQEPMPHTCRDKYDGYISFMDVDYNL